MQHPQEDTGVTTEDPGHAALDAPILGVVNGSFQNQSQGCML